MTSLVVDASTIVKWFVVEELSDAARRVLGSGDDFLAPDFMPAEVMSALLRKYRRRELDEGDLFIARDSIRGAFELVDSEPFLDAALRIAIAYRRSAYDSTYVILARDRGCQMVTADLRLYNAIAPVYPETMLWIQSLPE